MARAPARRFQATETTAYRDLQSTMRKLGATSLRVTRDLLDSSSVKAEIVVDRGGRRYTVSCDRWKLWLDNFRAAERTIYYLYLALHDWGALTSEQALDAAFSQFFSGFEATPSDALLMLPSGQHPWWEVLGVAQTASELEIRNAYRALARVHHPDAGGDPAEFQRLRRAYDEAVTATKGAK
jgi:hypothetical protein